MSGGERLREVVSAMDDGPWETVDWTCKCCVAVNGPQGAQVIYTHGGMPAVNTPTGIGIVLLRNIADELADVVDAARNPDLAHPGDGYTGLGCDEWDAAYARLQKALAALDKKLEKL